MKAPPIKNLALWLLAIFVVYAILTAPISAADMIGSAWDVVSNSVENIAIFFDELLQ